MFPMPGSIPRICSSGPIFLIVRSWSRKSSSVNSSSRSFFSSFCGVLERDRFLGLLDERQHVAHPQHARSRAPASSTGASGISGVVLTKMDGDARGGAALSVVGVVGVPIAFVGTGERLQDLEPFHPDRLVSRMLGMGDVLSLIEKAEEAVSTRRREKLEKKLRLDDFTLEDFRDQLRTIRKMGPLEQILGMMPGMGNMKEFAAAARRSTTSS